MSLVARYLEEHSVATVIIGSARDIVEHCAVPRYLHSDFPLGNPCGKPYEQAMQIAIVRQALDLFHKAAKANTLETTPFSWGDDNSWRDDYSKVDDSNREELARKGEERRRRQTEDKASGVKRAAMIAEG